MPLRQVKIRSEALRCTLNSALLCRRSAQQGFYFAEKRQDMGIGYYFRNGKTGFQTSGGCHLTKACWDEAWLLDDTDRALVRDGEGYALLRIRSGRFIRLDCDRAAPYGDTLLRIRREERYGLVDFEGRTIIPPRYDVLTNHHAQFNIIGRRGRYGLLNRQGGWVRPLRYDAILPVNQRGNDRLACIRRHRVVFL
jgi:hypothetical protein